MRHRLKKRPSRLTINHDTVKIVEAAGEVDCDSTVLASSVAPHLVVVDQGSSPQAANPDSASPEAAVPEATAPAARIPQTGASPESTTDLSPIDDTTVEKKSAKVSPAIAMLTTELKRHRVPLIILACILLSPKLLWLWGISVFLKRPATFAWQKLPTELQLRTRNLIPAKVRQADWVDELNEGMNQARPFTMGVCFLLCVPFALVWMLVSWCERFIGFPKAKGFIAEPDRLEFTQNRDKDENSEDNFMHSSAFPLTALGLAILGVPAAISMLLFSTLGVDKLLGVSIDQHFVTHFVFFSYLCCLGAAMATLFMRAWFTFPLNFLSKEHRLELTPKGLRRHSQKGWFLYVITLNLPSAGVDSLRWNDVHAVNVEEDGGARLYPLPVGVFEKNSLVYKGMNKLAALIDGVNAKLCTSKRLTVTSAQGSCLGSIPIELSELNSEQRIRLFHQIRLWAPHAIISPKVQELLVGSVVLQGDIRYTQIWFDVMTSRNKDLRTSQLESGDLLLKGEWKILEKLASGGQANAYLAERRDGKKCVLKEFILSRAESSGALLESARDFESEASLLSQLKHDRIVGLVDFFAEGGRVYVVLEHIEGQSLRALVKEKGPLEQAQVVRMALEICDILSYLHGLTPAMVHRDLTPENIMVQADGTIKLIDFSLAIRHKENTMTASVGKNSFTPPEQFRDQSCPQSDIYSFGATLYYALTGAIPKPLSKSCPKDADEKISDSLSAIVGHATELELADRYESVEWLRLDLESLL